MSEGLFILRGREAVPEDDLLTWARWFESHDRSVKHEKIGGFEISTVFLGIDSRLSRLFRPDGPPALFETVIFRGPGRIGGTVAMERCATWEQAEEIHERMKRRIIREING